MPEELTGEMLMLRYVFPCLENRVMLGKLDRDHYNEALSLMETGGSPRRSLFRFCSPYAYRRLCEYAKASGKERWALETVREFWRRHHGHRGDCRVRRGKIIAIESKGEMTAARVAPCDAPENGNPEEPFLVLNLCRLPLAEGQNAYFHRRVLAEIDDESE